MADEHPVVTGIRVVNQYLNDSKGVDDLISRKSASFSLAALALALMAGAPVSAHVVRNPVKTAKVSLLETGSTLLYPLYLKWVPAYEKTHPTVAITPAGTGSGTGISDALAGTVQIGASDAYLSPSELTPDVINVPLAISAQVISYNLPGIHGHLNINGKILAGIYTGHIKNWNNPAIAQANPGVKLPDHAIIPVRRSDGSGDSFLFTSYMTDSAPSVWTSGYSTQPNWPKVAAEGSAVGNGGMVEFLKANRYSIAYVGISYLNQLTGDHMGYAALENRAGHYVLPTRANIVDAADASVAKTPRNEAISLVFSSGVQSYPIINYEYAILKVDQPSVQTAGAVKTFLTWALHTGNQAKFLNAVHFLPLPQAVVKLSATQLTKLH